jgi:hypothetical protein
MITLPIWQAIAALFVAHGVGFVVGFALAAAMAMAGRADDAIEQAADPRLRVDAATLTVWQREAIGGDE